ncbi:MAG: hypothetical protein AB3X41_10750 [Leptothrix ochracea]|uniref:hypothetical protein n=1 Tax=Leptothrix ochracea TaxID=735331 RepID=UPI0034E2582F
MRRRLEALGHAIRQASDPRDILLLGAQRALLLARLGDISLARRDIRVMREAPLTVMDPTLACWLWLAEGVTNYFENLAPTARAHIARAHALATATAAPVVQALASAWLAHLDIAAQDDQAVVTHVDEAFKYSDTDHHAARARAALVMAWAWHLSGNEHEAQPWYSLARRHATEEGDGGTLGSVMHNMAALQVIRLRLHAITGPIDRRAAYRALLSTESSAFLNVKIHAHALQTHLHLLRAQIFLMLGQNAEALRLYNNHAPYASRQGLAETMGLLLADRAWCLCQTGGAAAQAEASLVAEDAAIALKFARTDEETAIGHAQLAQVTGYLGHHSAKCQHRNLALAALERHQQHSSERQQLLKRSDLSAWAHTSSSGRNTP